MKLVIVKCSVCETELARIKKSQFRQQDLQEYRDCMSCDCGGAGNPSDPVDID